MNSREDNEEINLIRVVFFENKSDAYWYEDVAAVPSIGSRVEIGQAPKGHFHRVTDIIHKIGRGHIIEIYLDRLAILEVGRKVRCAGHSKSI